MRTCDVRNGSSVAEGWRQVQHHQRMDKTDVPHGLSEAFFFSGYLSDKFSSLVVSCRLAAVFCLRYSGNHGVATFRDCSAAGSVIRG